MPVIIKKKTCSLSPRGICGSERIFLWNYPLRMRKASRTPPWEIVRPTTQIKKDWGNVNLIDYFVLVSLFIIFPVSSWKQWKKRQFFIFGSYRKTEKQNIDSLFRFWFARLNGIIEWSDDTRTKTAIICVYLL